ncbi:MAG: 30S ribosomal protein S7 [Bdellovibrionales bacterium]|nr:30S ribosomal protein S7 [Bdellovibrionales bacterium]
MSRRNRKIDKREPAVDPKYEDPILGHFINKLMWDGKKELARKIVYSAFEEIGKKASQDALSVFKKALENCKPSLEVRSRRVGGATYQVPVDVRPVRRATLAMRWLILHSRSRKEKTMASRLAEELLDAYNNKGQSIKKKEDVHRMAEANRAFSHYNW